MVSDRLHYKYKGWTSLHTGTWNSKLSEPCCLSYFASCTCVIGLWYNIINVWYREKNSLQGSQEQVRGVQWFREANVEDSLAVSREFVASLYDQKAKLQADYSTLNKFRVRLATKKEASLAKLPPCEATFHQHVLRASLHTYIWNSSQKAQPSVRSPLMFGWEDKGGLVPVFFRGQMSSDFLQDLVCSCKGKSICSSSCVCFEQNLSCTDLCPCLKFSRFLQGFVVVDKIICHVMSWQVHNSHFVVR